MNIINTWLKTLGLISLLTLLQSCNHLFYHPDDHQYIDVSKLGVDYEEGFIESSDGERIHFWDFAPLKEHKGTVVQFHGNAQNMSAHFLYAVWLIEEGFRVITFDYRGYGQSSGSPERKGMVEDGKAVLEHACKGSQGKNVFVLGQSLGGAIAPPVVAEVGEDCVCALVLDSTFHSYRDIAQGKLASFFLTWPLQWPLSFLISDDYSPEQYYDRIKAQTLVVHGDEDPVIPIHFGKTVRDLLGKGEFWTVPGGGHTAAFSNNSPFRKKLANYLEAKAAECKKL